MDKKREKLERETYLVEEVCQLMGLGINATYRGIHRGEIPSVKVGGRYLIPRAALRRLLEQQR